MLEVTSFTDARSQDIEDDTLLSAVTVGDILTLRNKLNEVVFSGNVKGIVGLRGPTGEVSEAQLVAAIQAAHADGAITTTQLADNSVSLSKIAFNAVTTNAIGDDAIIDTKLASDSVTVANIAGDTITASAIPAGAVSQRALGYNSVSQSKFAPPTEYTSGNVKCSRMADFVTVYTVVPGWVVGSAVTLPVGFRPTVNIGFPANAATNPVGGIRVFISTAGVLSFSSSLASDQLAFCCTYKGA